MEQGMEEEELAVFYAVMIMILHLD